MVRVPLAEALALGPEPWDALLGLVPAASPCGGWAWLRAWAEAAPPSETAAAEALLLCGGDGALRGALPLLARRLLFRRVPMKVLTWAIGDVGCPDHLDVLAAPNADFDALAAALEAMPWRVMILDNLAESAPNADRLGRALTERGHAVRRRALWGCPYVDLPESWETYLARQSRTRRQTLRRKERRLRYRHAVTLSDYGADRFEEGWGHLVRLHGERWGGQGAFGDPRAARLQYGFARDMARQGRLWLATLDLDGAPAAAWYGFARGDTVYFYQGGRGLRWRGESVGMVLMGLMIRRAIERGYRRLDLLRGEDEYKHQWTRAGTTATELVVFRSGWRGLAARALDRTGEWSRRLRARPRAEGW